MEIEGGRMSGLPWISPEKRFWLKVWPRGDCWEWRGYKDKFGYGQFTIGPLPGAVLAHRFAYECAKGTIPPDRDLDHICRHPWCVKPSHLEAVTHQTNLLRGECPSARHARKTCCPKCGSQYETRFAASGTKAYRKCVPCAVERESRRPPRPYKPKAKRHATP